MVRRRNERDARALHQPQRTSYSGTARSAPSIVSLLNKEAVPKHALCHTTPHMTHPDRTAVISNANWFLCT